MLHPRLNIDLFCHFRSACKFDKWKRRLGLRARALDGPPSSPWNMRQNILKRRTLRRKSEEGRERRREGAGRPQQRKSYGRAFS